MAKRSKGTVGVVGLGIMGGAFAQEPRRRRLARARLRHRRRPHARAAKRAGVEIAADVDDARRRRRRYHPDQPAEAAGARRDRRARSPRPSCRRKIVVETSTFTLADKEQAERALRKAGHVMLDCPVSGTGAQAAVKDIVVYASGDATAIASGSSRCFADFSRAVYDVGAFGNGSKMKYVANLLVAIHNVATAEAMVLGMKAGLDPQLIFDLIRAGAGTSRVFEVRAPMMVEGQLRRTPP